jgi:iron complex outermembrane receptor protein
MPSYVTFGYNTRPFLDTTTDSIAQYIVTSPYNISATNQGLELAWQQPLWKNFGGLVNYSYADGKTENGSALVGSSKNTANVEVYYENDTFSARLAYNYRSSFLVGLANVTPQYAAGLGTLAASMNYKINDQLTITFDGLNLNNPIIKYYSNAEQPQAFYSNGRQYFLGVRIAL